MSTDAEWTEKAKTAPFRASVNQDPSWDTDNPSYTLAAAYKRSPGGRLLLAFELEEVRDFFVDGHEENGAQAEPDGATRASARHKKDAAAKPVVSLDEAFAAYHSASNRLNLAREEVDQAFLLDIMLLARRGEIAEAAAILHSMPGRCEEKTIAMSRLLDMGLRDEAAWCEPAPLTQPRAAALRTWQRAFLVEKKAHAVMSDLLAPLVEERGPP